MRCLLRLVALSIADLANRISSRHVRLDLAWRSPAAASCAERTARTNNVSVCAPIYGTDLRPRALCTGNRRRDLSVARWQQRGFFDRNHAPAAVVTSRSAPLRPVRKSMRYLAHLAFASLLVGSFGVAQAQETRVAPAPQPQFAPLVESSRPFGSSGSSTPTDPRGTARMTVSNARRNRMAAVPGARQTTIASSARRSPDGTGTRGSPRNDCIVCGPENSLTR